MFFKTGMDALNECIESIKVYDAKIIELMEKLDDPDLSSEKRVDYEESLTKLSDMKKNEVANMNAIKSNLMPEWLTTIISTVGALGSIGAILLSEYKGAVIGSTATTILNKLRFR